MMIGDEVYIHGYIDEIRKDTVIIRNEGGYFGTVESEIATVTTFEERNNCGTNRRDGAIEALDKVIDFINGLFISESNHASTSSIIFHNGALDSIKKMALDLKENYYEVSIQK